mmetsp:Transcript_5627/g.9544  ORF Transcript_5627/g.9544 Transcript_5627/m.9544 type:complete len:110 (-) Transcript_5627:2104-2433(-)
MIYLSNNCLQAAYGSLRRRSPRPNFAVMSQGCVEEASSSFVNSAQEASIATSLPPVSIGIIFAGGAGGDATCGGEVTGSGFGVGMTTGCASPQTGAAGGAFDVCVIGVI